MRSIERNRREAVCEIGGRARSRRSIDRRQEVKHGGCGGEGGVGKVRAKPTHGVGHLELHGLVLNDELQLVATHAHADPCWQLCVAGACVPPT